MLHLGVVGFILTITTAIQEPQGGTVVVQRTNVADKRCRVHHCCLPLPENVVPVHVGELLLVELAPLGHEMGVALLASLDATSTVHGS